MRGAGETPSVCHRSDRGAIRLARQIAPALLQATPLDPPADSGLFTLEQLVQIAQGYVVGSGDDLRGQVGVRDVTVDERLDPQQQCPVSPGVSSLVRPSSSSASTPSRSTTLRAISSLVRGR